MKTAIITGASSGLGRELARQLTDVFPDLECCWLIARREERLEEVAREMVGVETVCLPLDLCDPASFTALETRLAEEKPEVRVLINNAGWLSWADGGGSYGHADADGGFEPPGHDGGDEFDDPLYAGRCAYSQHLLHRGLLPYAQNDRIRRQQGVCVLLYRGA